MAKNVVLILEYGDGGYSCYNDEPLGNYAVIDGDGATAEEAKADFMRALQECRDDDPDNKDLQDLTFTYKYDVQAFFKEFSFLNATEIARRAGINPSLMRQYVSGVKTAGEKTYQRLNACMSNIKADLQATVFWWSENLNIVNTTISISAFTKYIGMNASLLRQYAAGIKVPQAKSLKRIRQGIAKIKGDLDAGLLIDKPVLQYVWTMCNQKLVVLHKN